MHYSTHKPLPQRLPPRKGQTGAALIIGLVLLLVLTVLGVSGMRTASMEIAMAGNTQYGQDAFQTAEDGIDVAIGSLNYTTDEVRSTDVCGNPALGCHADTTYFGNTLVPDRAFSAGAVEAFHFDTVATGRAARGAISTHTQSFYVVGSAL